MGALHFESWKHHRSTGKTELKQGYWTWGFTWEWLILTYKAVQDAASEQGVEVMHEVWGWGWEAEALVAQHGTAAGRQLQQAGQEGQRLVRRWCLLLLRHSLQPPDDLPLIKIQKFCPRIGKAHAQVV